jgi:demethylmenaquinone methyltransferase/2-methoxy-6-polyprenyl-1,4-benzoquinol methylase
MSDRTPTKTPRLPGEPDAPSEGRTAGAWSPELLAGDPHGRIDKADRVRSMFAAIAHRYDLNNRLHSFGLDQTWRRKVVRLARVDATTDVVDVACGTGDLTEAFREAGPRSIVGIDYTREMLEIARVKGSARPGTIGPAAEYREGDATRLELPDGCCDVVSIAFGLRNVGDATQALREFHRILRPGGRLLVLEFSEPRNPVLRWGNRLYTHHVMPWTATLIAGDRSGAYKYLPRSVETFLTPETLAERCRSVGFSAVEQHTLTFGVCTVTVARR